MTNEETNLLKDFIEWIELPFEEGNSLFNTPENLIKHFDEYLHRKIITNEEKRKKIRFANTLLDVIANLSVPMLMYEEEKEVTREALIDYIAKLEGELNGGDVNASS